MSGRTKTKSNSRCSNNKHSEWGNGCGEHGEVVRIERLCADERNFFLKLGNKKQNRRTQCICVKCRDRLRQLLLLACEQKESCHDDDNKLTSPESSSSSSTTTAIPSSTSSCASSATDPIASTIHAEETVTTDDLDNDDDFTKLLAEVKCLSNDKLLHLVRTIAEREQSNIGHDLVANLTGMYQDMDIISNIDTKAWLDERNPVVLAFLQGISGGIGSSRQYHMARAVESIYRCKNPLVVLPLAFSENIVQYSVSNSKIATNINAAGGGGSYETVRQWLNNRAVDELPPVKGDVIVAFDNDQVIGKTYHARAENKSVKASVITAVCTAEIDESGTLQEREDLMPCKWQDGNNVPDDVVNETSEIYQNAEKVSTKFINYMMLLLAFDNDQIIGQTCISMDKNVTYIL